MTRTAAALAIAALALSACSGTPAATPTPTPTPEVVDMLGSMVITPGGDYGYGKKKGDTCEWQRRFPDVPGASVTITDDAGKVIGSTSLDTRGIITEVTEQAGTTIPIECRFGLVARGLPVSPFYGVEVGRRGKVSFTLDQVRAGDVQLVLK